MFLFFRLHLGTTTMGNCHLGQPHTHNHLSHNNRRTTTQHTHIQLPIGHHGTKNRERERRDERLVINTHIPSQQHQRLQLFQVAAGASSVAEKFFFSQPCFETDRSSHRFSFSFAHHFRAGLLEVRTGSFLPSFLFLVYAFSSSSSSIRRRQDRYRMVIR